MLIREKQLWPVKGNRNRSKNSCLIEVGRQQAESTGRDLLTRVTGLTDTGPNTGPAEVGQRLVSGVGYFLDCSAGGAGGGSGAVRGWLVSYRAKTNQL